MLPRCGMKTLFSRAVPNHSRAQAADKWHQHIRGVLKLGTGPVLDGFRFLRIGTGPLFGRV